MTNKKFNAVEVWKQMEDLAVPRLRLTVYERIVYSHLMRHGRLEGKLRIRFGILRLAEATGLSDWAIRKAVSGLAAKGALRLAERSKKGHVVEVRLPKEIRGVRADKIAAGDAIGRAAAVNLEGMDFLENRELREAIHRRENGRCFYCMRRMKPAVRCLDHVVPQVRGGGNSYRNLVSVVFRMQCAEERATGGGSPAVALSGGPLKRRGPERAAEGGGTAGRGEAAAED